MTRNLKSLQTSRFPDKGRSTKPAFRPKSQAGSARDVLSSGVGRSGDIQNWACIGSATICGLFCAAVVYALIGNRLVLALDEGIYVHGAERILSGQHLYRDFFAFTGPGTYWLLSFCSKIFSAGVATAHGLLSLEIGTIVGCVYLIVNRSMGRLFGSATALVVLALLMPFVHRLYTNHRWDSSCCLTVAATALLVGARRPAITVAAGLLAGCATIFTPPTLLVSIVVTGLLLLTPEWRRAAGWFATGVLLALTIAAVILTAQDSLLPMLHSFAWVGQHYRRANLVPYGFVPPELQGTANGRSPLHEVLIRMPAALPVLSCATILWLAIRRQAIAFELLLLLAAGLGLVASCYPRVAANNLLFAMPLLVAVLPIAGKQLLSLQTYRGLAIAFLATSGFAVFWTVTSQMPTLPISSALGTIQCSPRDGQNVEFATTFVHTGETLFVYPYQPIWYSLTGGVNPTRFDFLQPGMMTREDETQTLEALRTNPPEWVIWHNLAPRMVFSIWPGSDPNTLHFPRIERFIRTNYSRVQPADNSSRYAVAIFHRIGK